MIQNVVLKAAMGHLSISSGAHLVSPTGPLTSKQKTNPGFSPPPGTRVANLADILDEALVNLWDLRMIQVAAMIDLKCLLSSMEFPSKMSEYSIPQ